MRRPQLAPQMILHQTRPSRLRCTPQLSLELLPILRRRTGTAILLFLRRRSTTHARQILRREHFSPANLVIHLALVHDLTLTLLHLKITLTYFTLTHFTLPNLHVAKLALALHLHLEVLLLCRRHGGVAPRHRWDFAARRGCGETLPVRRSLRLWRARGWSTDVIAWGYWRRVVHHTANGTRVRVLVVRVTHQAGVARVTWVHSLFSHPNVGCRPLRLEDGVSLIGARWSRALTKAHGITVSSGIPISRVSLLPHTEV